MPTGVNDGVRNGRQHFRIDTLAGTNTVHTIDKTRDNENLVDQISETTAIGDAEVSGVEDNEVCVKLLSVAEVDWPH